jgi:limonene-1,2-epoxide hydrolase
MTATNEQFMRDFYALWRSADIDGIVGCLAPDCVYEDVPVNRPMRGQQAVREWLEAGFAHLDSIVMEIRTIASNGEWVLIERLDDHIKGSKHSLLPVMNATRIVDGKIAECRDYFDMVTVEKIGLAESA